MKRMKTKKRTRMLIKYHCKTSAKRLGMDWRLTPDYKKFMRRVRRNETPHKIFAQLSDGSMEMIGKVGHIMFKSIVLV